MTRRLDRIEPGHYEFRAVKGGLWLPAEIRIVNGIYTVSECGGAPLYTVRVEELPDLIGEQLLAGQAFEHRLLRVVLFGHPVAPARYRYLLQRLAWARVHAPEHPAAAPYQPVDIGKTPIDTLF